MSSGEGGPPFLAALMSGGIAGTSVDVALYPIDTIKTRLQSPQGFIKAGGFNGVYRGLSAAATGSAPGAALFFSTYEVLKQRIGKSSLPEPVVHMTAAALGEVAACLVRVPTETVKQRMQAGMGSKAVGTLMHIVAEEGGIMGLYAGFGITVMREIPFAFIQFPIYEFCKSRVSEWLDRPTRSYEAALCGSFSGGIAAAATTPLDVIKTRLMLGADSAGVPYKGLVDTFQRLRIEATTAPAASAATSTAGVRAAAPGLWKIFFAGVQPRVMWISIGGFVFFGAYEQALRITAPLLQQ